MARKPIEGTVANNVLTYGTGGLNIDGSRIGHDDSVNLDTMQRQQASNPIRFGGAKPGDVISMYKPGGRWPANLIIDQDTAELLDEQSGTSKPSKGRTGKVGGQQGLYENGHSPDYESTWPSDNGGGASRFFYVAKASKRDRNEGLDHLADGYWELQGHQGNKAEDGVSNKAGTGTVAGYSKNFHPTVKPTSLMEYLIKLVTPPNGTVLDPFIGSGSTGKAAILQGFDFIGIEMTEEYLPIIEGRLKYAEHIVAERIKETSDKQSEVLF
jgi:site-specific DNA-methyltransferase (adenine-specific)